MRREQLPLLIQVPLWLGATSAAGAVTGLAVGVFRPGGFEPTTVLISILFGNVVGLTVLASSTIVFPRVRGLGPVLRAAALVLAFLAGSAAGTALVLYLFPLFVLRDLKQTFAVVGINGVLALIIGSVAYVYEDLRSRLAESLREVEEVRLVEAELREQAALAELAALQARINPHFFFNTLNTISSLLAEDAERAEEVLQKLADLFRYTFKASDARTVRLSEELRFIQGYLEIESARFGGRLRVRSDIDAAVLDVPVPGLVLQPLVENAVGHGIAPLAEGGSVLISARAQKSELVIEVADDGAGFRDRPEWLIREGHGLHNVRQRLTTMHGEAASLELANGPAGRGAIARIRLPLAIRPGATGAGSGQAREAPASGTLVSGASRIASADR